MVMYSPSFPDAPSLPQLEREEKHGGSDAEESSWKHGDEEDESEDDKTSQAFARSCTSSPSPQRPSLEEGHCKLSCRLLYEDFIASQLFGSDEGVVSSATMSVDDLVKSDKDNTSSDSPSPNCSFTFQTPVRPQSQRQSTPGASSSVAGRVFNFNEGSPNPGRTTPGRESETINNSDSVNEPCTPVQSRPRR